MTGLVERGDDQQGEHRAVLCGGDGRTELSMLQYERVVVIVLEKFKAFGEPIVNSNAETGTCIWLLDSPGMNNGKKA